MPYQPDDLGSEQIVYNGTATQMPLRGPSSQILRLPKPGSETQIQWAPTDRRAHDVEVRAFLMSSTPFGAVPHTDPQVLVALDFGHGKAVIHEPSQTVPPQNHRGGWTMPGRGFVTRIAARELKVSLFYYGAFATGNAPHDLVISISFMPVLGMQLPPPQSDDTFSAGLVSKLMIFPATATEWRLFDFAGQPYPAAFAVDILLVDPCGHFLPPGPLTPLDRSKFAAWGPIPPRAAAWDVLQSASPDAKPIGVAYR